MSPPPFVYLVLWYVYASTCSAETADRGAVTRISVQKCAEYTANWCPDREDLYKKHPYVAAVKLGYPFNPSHEMLVCAGTLISERHVLTLGHCTVNLQWGMKIMGLKIGKPSEAGGLQERDVQRVIVHPDYEYYSGGADYDIAILELVSPVTITDYVRPVCLHQSQNVSATTGTEAVWIIRPEELGIMKESRILIHVKEACSEIYGNFFLMEEGISDAMICASYDDYKAECLANSGVPLLVSAGQCIVQAAGLLAYGTTCGYGSPVVYTNIASYLDWIESVVWPHQSYLLSPGDV